MTSTKKLDTVAHLGCLAKKDRPTFLGGLVLDIVRLVFLDAPNRDAARELLGRHGIGDLDWGDLQIAGTRSGEDGLERLLSDVGGRVQDQIGFAREASALRGKGIPVDIAFPNLSSVTTNDGYASGVLSFPDSPVTSTVYFVQEQGSWRITLAPPPSLAEEQDVNER